MFFKKLRKRGERGNQLASDRVLHAFKKEADRHGLRFTEKELKESARETGEAWIVEVQWLAGGTWQPYMLPYSSKRMAKRHARELSADRVRVRRARADETFGQLSGNVD